MAYQIKVNLAKSNPESFQQIRSNLSEIVPKILRRSLDAVQQQAVENVSGVPYTDPVSGQTRQIEKRSGKLAASIRTQFPYGSPYQGRIFARAMTRYANNPEEWNYAAILEYGRGEIKPKYTPSMQKGNVKSAALTVPSGGQYLISGQNGFRGRSGNYRFVKRIPPMEGKHWMAAAVDMSQDDLRAIAKEEINKVING